MTRLRQRARAQQGVAMVEFALVLPLLVLVCLGTVDLGRAYMTWNQLKNGAREGAAYAQLHTSKLAGTSCTTSDSAQWYALHETGSASASAFTVKVVAPSGTYNSTDSGCLPSTNAATSGQTVTVTASKTLTLITPFLKGVLGSDPTIRASVTVRVQ